MWERKQRSQKRRERAVQVKIGAKEEEEEGEEEGCFQKELRKKRRPR